jgi:hypothetical protein
MKRPIALMTLALLGLASLSLITLITSSSAIGAPLPSDPALSLLVSGLEGAIGSTVGPGGPCMSLKPSPAGFRASIPRPGISRHSPLVFRPEFSLSLSAERWTLPSSGTPRTSS